MLYFKIFLIAWIWFVTAVDIWCCQWLTVETELNPLAKMIFAHFGVWTLLSCKVVGTFIVTELLRYLSLYYSVVISFFMLLLLLVLMGVISI